MYDATDAPEWPEAPTERLAPVRGHDEATGQHSANLDGTTEVVCCVPYQPRGDLWISSSVVRAAWVDEGML